MSEKKHDNKDKTKSGPGWGSLQPLPAWKCPDCGSGTWSPPEPALPLADVKLRSAKPAFSYRRSHEGRKSQAFQSRCPEIGFLPKEVAPDAESSLSQRLMLPTPSYGSRGL